MNNKLTPVLGYADLLASMAHPPRTVRRLHSQGRGGIGQHHPAAAPAGKPESGSLEVVDVRDVLHETAMMLQFEVREARARLQLEVGSSPLLVRGDAAQLKQVVMNLALNGLHAAQERPEPVVHVSATDDHGTVAIVVRGQRGRHPVGGPRADFRSLLHHEGTERHRPWPEYLPQHCAPAWRRDQGGEPGGRRGELCAPAAGPAGRGAGGAPQPGTLRPGSVALDRPPAGCSWWRTRWSSAIS
ncbi:MAG: hypothetical protein WDM96_16375 [Lacunisphaera sp.]